MGTVFVHTKGRGQYAAARQRNPRQRDGALNGAILPIFAMKDGKRDIDWQGGYAGGFKYIQLVCAAVQRKHSGNAVFTPKPSIIQQMLQAAGIVIPAAVLRDADREDVVFVPIQMAQHCMRRSKGYAVFWRTAAKKHGYVFLFHRFILSLLC